MPLQVQPSELVLTPACTRHKACSIVKQSDVNDDHRLLENTLNLNKIQILIEFMYLSSCEIVPMATLEKYHFFAVYNLTDDTEENNSKFNVFQELY